jgi:orotate phosphoribosyltransferase
MNTEFLHAKTPGSSGPAVAPQNPSRGEWNFDFVFSARFPSVAAMEASQTEILEIFTRTRALLRGHFVLRSGLHSGHYFQCAQVCQHMDAVQRLGELLVEKLRREGFAFSTVLAPAMGGLVIGQEVARRAGARYIFAEKENNMLVLRRGFTFAPGERVLIVEDVVTRGGRVQECLAIVRAAGAEPVGVAMLVDRSAGSTRFDVPAVSLLELSFPTYPADAVPPELAKIPVEKPGS